MKAIYLICGGRRPGRFVRGMRAFCALSAVAAVSSLQAAEFFVSPDGDDSAPGTFMKPFATIVRARDAVRDSRTPRSRATVYLRGGEYNVRKPLVLSFADSGTAGAPVTYRAWKDETPVLTGGFAIPPAAWHPADDSRLPETSKGKVWCADVSSLGANALATDAPCGYDIRNPKFLIRSLFLDGKRLTPARHPNEGFIWIDKVVDWKKRVFSADVGEFSRWTRENAPDLEALGYWRFLWGDQTLPITADAKTRTFTVGDASQWSDANALKKRPFYLQNALAALDAPGEWHLDREKKRLFVYSEARPSGRYVLSVAGESLVVARNLTNARFEGIVFMCGRHHGIELDDAEDVTFAGCVVRDFGGHGIVVRRGRDVTVKGCVFHTFGHCAMTMEGGDRRKVEDSGITVEANDVSDTGLAMRTYTPGVWADGCGHRIVRNHFHDIPSSAMRLNGNEFFVASNLVERVVLESDDQGAVDMWGDPTYRGSRFVHNIWRNIGRVGSLVACGQTGIRFDDAICGNLVYGNRFENCSKGHFGAVQIHGGRGNAIRNNVFSACDKGVTFYSGWPLKRWRAYLDSEKTKNRIAAVDGETYRAKYPEWAGIRDAPQRNFIENNVFVGVKHATWGKADIAEKAFRENPVSETVMKGNVSFDAMPADFSGIAGFAPLPPESAIGPGADTALAAAMRKDACVSGAEAQAKKSK